MIMRKFLIRKLDVALCYYILVLIFLFCSTPVKAQFDNKKYDKESFVVGLLNEYMGYKRIFVPESEGYHYDFLAKVESFPFKYAPNYALFIDSLFSPAYPDIYFMGSKGVTVYSPTLSKVIDTYYEWKPSKFQGRDTVGMKPSFVWLMHKETLTYTGVLQKEAFETMKQKLSYIMGAYLRFGGTNSENEGGKYRLFMPNAAYKAEACAELLKQSGFKNVVYTFIEGNIPTPHIVTFDASENLEEVLNDAVQLKKEIQGRSVAGIEAVQESAKYVVPKQMEFEL